MKVGYKLKKWTSGCTCSILNCDDYEVCTDDWCQPSTGYTHTPINCDIGNKCLSFSCDKSYGCQYEFVPVDYGDADRIVTEVNCNDHDECTNDYFWDHYKGCIHLDVICEDDNLCTRDLCFEDNDVTMLLFAVTIMHVWWLFQA